MAQLYYSPISINPGQVPSTQTDFPMLLNYTDTRLKTVANGGHVANGNDIRPYNSSGLGATLTYELERYNASTGELVMWVKVPSLSSSTTPIYLGYGDISLTTNGSNGPGTFSNGFIGVYHFGNGTTISFADSTGVHTAGAWNGSPTATAGQISGAANFVSTSLHSLILSGVINSAAITYSAWINATSLPGAFNRVICVDDASGHYIVLSVKSSGKMSNGANNSFYDGTGVATLSIGTWYHVVWTYDSSAGGVGYVNAVLDNTSVASGSLYTSFGISTFIGLDANAGQPGYWNGKIDEARLSSVSRSADWVTTEYNNQSAPSTFATLGTEVSLTSSQRGWFNFFPR